MNKISNRKNKIGNGKNKISNGKNKINNGKTEISVLYPFISDDFNSRLQHDFEI